MQVPIGASFFLSSLLFGGEGGGRRESGGRGDGGWDLEGRADGDKDFKGTSLILPTGIPSNSTTTSPGTKPARSAGDPGVTWL